MCFLGFENVHVYFINLGNRLHMLVKVFNNRLFSIERIKGVIFVMIKMG